jgi:tellurite methyltransferase
VAEADRLAWEQRYREETQQGVPAEPVMFLKEVDQLLPSEGCAIDVAGGAGRNALWLAGRGLEVTLTDGSETALRRAQQAAQERGVALQTLLIDLESEPFPSGPWDLIVCTFFLWRPLFAVFPEALKPGGRLIVVHPTISNLLRHERPSSRHLLDDGELPTLVQPLEILKYDEGWTDEDRHLARLVAQRRAAGEATID